MAIESLTFTSDYRCFKKGRILRFEPGLNVIVGANGAGKSTIVQAVRAPVEGRQFGRRNPWRVLRSGDGPVLAWDSETDNLRTLSHFGEDMMAQVTSMYRSHGESNIAALLRLIAPVRTSDVAGTIVLDQPEAGLSLANVAGLTRVFADLVGRGWQLIVVTHHPDLIAASPTVLDLDRGRRVKSVTYLASARQPPKRAKA